MSIRLGLNIYNKPWLVEPAVALRMLDEWERIKSSQAGWDYKALFFDEEEANTQEATQALFQTENVIHAPDNSYSLNRFTGFSGATVAVISLEGPLMKADYCGALGTESIRQLVKLADNTQSVETILFRIDSPGGTVDGTKALADTIAACSKQTIAYVDGMMCSAAYWIGSSCKTVYAGSSTDIIGSIGTMFSWYDNSESLKQRGVVLREYYATKSTDKNKMTRDAGKDEGKMLIAEMLDPLNDVFLSAVKSNRPSVSDLALTGKVYTGENAIQMGLIDKIQSLDHILKTALNKSKKTKSYMAQNTSFQNVMSAVEATEIPVVEGGFLMTEEQLNKIDTSLADSADAQTKLQDLQAKLDAAIAAQTNLKTKLQEAETKVADLKAAAKKFFGKEKSDQQDPEQHEESDASESFAHNLAADEFL